MPAEPSETEAIEHELRIDARPETVFDYFTDPAKLVQWMGIDATLDPRPGGVCRISVNGAATMRGEYVQVAHPSRIVFTWGWEEEHVGVPPQSTAVEVSLTPDGDGTILRLVHRRLPPAAVSFHQVGWTHYLKRLGVLAGGGDPGHDAWGEVRAASRALRNDRP